MSVWRPAGGAEAPLVNEAEGHLDVPEAVELGDGRARREGEGRGM